MTRCTIPPTTCRRWRSAPCCKTCGEADCPVKCQNDPAWCNCWTDRPPKSRRERKFDPAKILHLHEQGLTQKEIAGQMGCSRNTVYLALHEMGVKQRGQA